MASPERSLWRHRDFMLLWGGQTVSEIGSSVTFLAFPLLAVKTLHASTFQVALLSVATSAAFLLIALPAGAWVDRWRRKRVLVRSDLGRLLLVGSVPVAQALGVLTLAQLYVVALASSVLSVFFDVAYQSYLPEVVDADQLIDGNGKLGTTQSFAQVAGPGVGGALVGLVGAPYAVAVDAVSYLVSGGATAAIRRPDPVPVAKAQRQRLRADIREGLTFVTGHPVLSRIVGCTGTSNFGSAMAGAVEVVFLVRTLHASSLVVGLVFSLGSVGGILGGLSAGWIARRVGSARTIWLSVLVTAPFAFLGPLSFAGPGVLLLSLGSFVVIFGAVVYNVAQVSYRQAICPPRLLGRMNASVRFIVWGSMPLGALAGGGLASLTSPRLTLVVGGVIALSACLFVIRSPLFGLRDVPMEPPEPVLPTEAAAEAPVPV